MYTKKRLILIHGLHHSPLFMKSLEKKLTMAGYQVYCLNYTSVFGTLEQHSQKLHHWLTQNHDSNEPLYMVGHSLGGLVIRDFLARFPQWRIKNCVTLGTPHLGSTSAYYTKKTLPFMVGKSYRSGLDGHVKNLPQGICMGVVAGSKSQGIGKPFLVFHNHKYNVKDRANDGTVYVSETRLQRAKDYIVLHVTHTGMLFNNTVAQQTIHFLEHSAFFHNDDMP